MKEEQHTPTTVKVALDMDTLEQDILSGLVMTVTVDHYNQLCNSHAKLTGELADYKEGCEGLKLALQDVRPKADCYERVCQSLGIEKDILGHVAKREEVIAGLVGALEVASKLLYKQRQKDGYNPEIIDACYKLTDALAAEKEM